jgi:hypothetical protein
VRELITPTIKEKVIRVLQNRMGEEFSREEIIDLICLDYPDTNRSSVMPSDYCYNMVIAGIIFDFQMFEHLEKAQYHCLGRHYFYIGPIYWNGKQVGERQEGRFRLRQNAPQRARQRWWVSQWIDTKQIEK